MSDNAIIGARKHNPICGIRRDKPIRNGSMPVFERKADERIAELESAIDALVDIDMGDEYWVQSEGYEALLATRHKPQKTLCDHKWVSADNEVVTGCEICIECKEVRADQQNIRENL